MVQQMDTRYRQTLYGTQTSQHGFIQGKFKPGQFSEEPSTDTPELTKDSTELGQDSSPGKQATEKPGSIYLLKDIYWAPTHHVSC